jgi:hypothetical protein
MHCVSDHKFKVRLRRDFAENLMSFRKEVHCLQIMSSSTSSKVMQDLSFELKGLVKEVTSEKGWQTPLIAAGKTGGLQHLATTPGL